MRLEPGDKIEFHLLSDGSASMRVKRGELKDFIGVLPRGRAKAVSITSIDKHIANTIRSKHGHKTRDRN